jgi:hypothetical protein
MDEKELLDLEKERAEFKYKIREMEDKDTLRDTQRKMAWYALFGMLLYPVAVIGANYFGLDEGAKQLSDMAGTYFMSTAAIVMTLFGAEAYVKKDR